MTISYLSFFQPTVLGASAAPLYTVPVAPATSLLRGGRVRLTNTTSGAVTATLYAVPASGTAGAGNAFVSAESVPGNGHLDVDVPIMPAGAILEGLAGAAASITIHMLSGSLFS